MIGKQKKTKIGFEPGTVRFIEAEKKPVSENKLSGQPMSAAGTKLRWQAEKRVRTGCRMVHCGYIFRPPRLLPYDKQATYGPDWRKFCGVKTSNQIPFIF